MPVITQMFVIVPKLNGNSSQDIKMFTFSCVKNRIQILKLYVCSEQNMNAFVF